jgi:hypothetical protein
MLFQRQSDGANCPYLFKTVTAHPDGKLSACGGHACSSAPDLNLGDWRTTELGELLAAGKRNPLLQWISVGGPEALRECVESASEGAPFARDYASRCHLCKDLLTRPLSRRVLKEHASQEARRVITGEIAELARIKALLFNADAGPDSF